MTTVIALDYGTKRIGVAVGDSQVKIAHPIEVINRKTSAHTKKEITRIIENWRPSKLVVGMPKSTVNNCRHKLHEEIKRFCKKLKADFSVPIVLIDESYTSVEAELKLKATGLKSQSIYSITDSLAASSILEDFFEGYYE